MKEEALKKEEELAVNYEKERAYRVEIAQQIKKRKSGCGKLKKVKNPEVDEHFSLALNKVINDNMEAAKAEILKKTIEQTSKIFSEMKSQTNTSNIQHSTVTCDGCRVKPILGNRYKCTVCNDFDYCEACEQQNSETHPHPFLKIRKPELAPVEIKCSIKEIKQEEVSQPSIENKSTEVVEEKKEFEDEKPKSGFFERLKEKIQTFPTKCNILEEMLKAKLNDLRGAISEAEKEKNKFRHLIPTVRQTYLLENITDDQILEAIAKANGDIEIAVCLLFA